MKTRIVILIAIISFLSCQKREGEYVCTPCDLPCDTLTFIKDGICPHCKMDLIKKIDIVDESKLELNKIDLKTGSGVFLIEGSRKRKKKAVKVYYHKPKNFSSNSKILIVIPGAGRNGDSYRDAWKQESEKYSVLILSPMYEEKKYPFEEYHLCGLVKELNLNESIKFSTNSNEAFLDEEIFNYQINLDKDEWLFSDFDRIFNLVVESTNTSQNEYDIFGHSAGGQILHRLALFENESKANRIIASNSGFYTLPDLETKLPFGMKNLLTNEEELTKSFNKKLILLIGELDNEYEKGGTLLRSTTVDKQGTHRLERAKYFFEFSKRKASKLNTRFNWKLEIIPDIGHNHEQMGNAASRILYE